MGHCWSCSDSDGNRLLKPGAEISDRKWSISRRAFSYKDSFRQKCLSKTSPSELEAEAETHAFDKLTDGLLKRVLEKLPTSALVNVRMVCKKWNAFILSSEIPPHVFIAKNVLFNFSAPELAVRIYSPRSTHWELEKKSLSFLLEAQIGDLADALWAPVSSFRWLGLVASGGGLLCFTSSSHFWALIVCNPMTRKWRRLQIPFASGQPQPQPQPQPQQQHDQLRMGNNNNMAPPPWAVKLWSSRHRQLDWQGKLAEELAVCIIVNNSSSESEHNLSTSMTSGGLGSYKLIVAGLYEGSERTTLVYNSSSAAWKRIADVPVMKSRQSRFCSRAIACGGHMYCLTGEFHDRYAILRRPTRLLKCDVQKETWTFVELPAELGFPNDLLEHRGRILLLTHDRYITGNSLRFYELQEKGEGDGVDGQPSFTETGLVPEMITTWLNDCQKQSNFHFSVRCLGIRNCIYISSKMDKEHKVLVYDASEKTCTTAKSPKNSDYIFDAGWQVFSPALHAIV